MGTFLKFISGIFVLLCVGWGEENVSKLSPEGKEALRKLRLPGIKLILDAQLAVDGEVGKYPEFKGNVITVYTHPLSQGGASNSHYDGNAQTYMDIGLAMGESMVQLLEGK